MDLDRRAFLAALAAAGAGAALPAPTASLTPKSQSLPDDSLKESLVFDSFGAPAIGVLRDGGRGILSGRGLAAIHVGLAGGSYHTALQALATWQGRFDRQPQQLVKVLSTSDIERCVSQGRLGILLGLQNVTCLDDNVDNLYRLHARGARVIHFTSDSRNLLGNRRRPGSRSRLSDFAVAAVETMNELGMVVDLSRCGEKMSRDGIQISRKAPAFTHTSCRALHNHRHAKSDELLRTIADRGGVIGIHPGDDRSSEDHLEHIAHAVNVAGIDHVGIASSSGGTSPRSRVSFLAVARGLERRGYRPGAIEKLLGGNWSRYLQHAL